MCTSMNKCVFLRAQPNLCWRRSSGAVLKRSTDHLYINGKMERKNQMKHGCPSLNWEGAGHHHHACFMMVSAFRLRQIHHTVIHTANFIFSVIGAVHTSWCFQAALLERGRCSEWHTRLQINHVKEWDVGPYDWLVLFFSNSMKKL